jgi:acetyl-CoA carboxylase, biotin carboxylase subunit
MQRVLRSADLAKAFVAARDKAVRFFGSGAVYVEKLLPRARHIEVQVVADDHGHALHLGERECSIQRRHQKVIEETPSPGVDEALRERLATAALSLVRHVGYSSLGTVEMLVQGGAFYFLEMNTRLQVEHTVTEMVTGLDLVEWQLRIAMGEALPARQQDVRFFGHAMQCRIYAEDPSRGFLPSPGTIRRLLLPAGMGVRNDVGVAEGDQVTPYYDPLIAKLVVHGPNRDECAARLEEALGAYTVEGVNTNLEMHRRVVAHPAFRQGQLTTDFLQEHLGLRI